MAADPLIEVQNAVKTLLLADPALAALVAGRIFVSVPAGADLPYVSFGPVDASEEDAEGIDGLEVTFQVDAWSRSGGASEAKRIGGAVRKALHHVDLDLTENAAVFCEHRTTRALRDPDGSTFHVAVTFRAIVEIA